MSPVGVIWRRTVSRAFYRYATAAAMFAFGVASAALLAFSMVKNEGVPVSLPVLWTESVAMILPFVAAYFAMDELSSERQSGRLELMFCAPVRERDLALGKYAGVLTLMALTVVLQLVLPLIAVIGFAPAALGGVHLPDFVPGLLALGLQGALWAAVSLAFSGFFGSGAVAGCASLFLTVALPRCGWAAVRQLASEGASAFGEMPLDVQVADMASGLFSTSVIFGYLLVTVFFVFITSRRLFFLRIGGGGRALKCSTLTAMALAAVATALAVMLAMRLDARLDLQSNSSDLELSAATRAALDENTGRVAVSVFLSRRDPRFRAVGRLLRSLDSDSRSRGCAGFDVRWVDPKLDVGEAERLVRDGAVENSVIFTRGRRSATVLLADGFSERAFASALHRLVNPLTRRNVYWTVGHGEYAFDDYGTWGMSDIARELLQDGYLNRRLDLTAGGEAFAADCALVIVAGAKRDFSRAEIERLDGYLRKGGRLLVLQNAGDFIAISSLFPGWGIKIAPFQLARTKTLSGSDVIVEDFAEQHPVTVALRGSRLVMERPIGYASTVAAESVGGAKRIEYTPLASVGGIALAAAVETGSGLGKDLSLRPTRIVCIGDGTFAVNGFLASRANANRDFFMNSVSYLAGTEAAGGVDGEIGIFTTGLDRRGARRFIRAAVLLPLAALLGFWLLIFVRRRG